MHVFTPSTRLGCNFELIKEVKEKYDHSSMLWMFSIIIDEWSSCSQYKYETYEGYVCVCVRYKTYRKPISKIIIYHTNLQGRSNSFLHDRPDIEVELTPNLCRMHSSVSHIVTKSETNLGIQFTASPFSMFLRHWSTLASSLRCAGLWWMAWWENT